MVTVGARFKMTEYDADWLHMRRLELELKELPEDSERYQEIRQLLDRMESNVLTEVDI